MRILKYNVIGQQIEPIGDHTGLVAGSEGYLFAEFCFSEEWEGCIKAASFWRFNEEYAVPLIDNQCRIPAEALLSSSFEVQVTGMREDYKLPTEKFRERQEVAR